MYLNLGVYLHFTETVLEHTRYNNFKFDHFILGLLFLYMASNLDDWLSETGKPNLKLIALVFLTINFLSATQDIAVDGWSLTMLKKSVTPEYFSIEGLHNISSISVHCFIFFFLQKKRQLCINVLYGRSDIWNVYRFSLFYFASIRGL